MEEEDSHGVSTLIAQQKNEQQLRTKATLKKAINNLESLLAAVTTSTNNNNNEDDDDAICSDNVNSMPIIINSDNGGEISVLVEQRWGDFTFKPSQELFVIGSDGEGTVTNSSSCCCSSSWSSDGNEPLLNSLSSNAESSHYKPCKKHVSFADSAGKPLVAVCSFGDTPYEMTPPEASAISNLLNLLQQSAIFNNNHHHPLFISEQQNNILLEPLFPEPLTNYTALVEKVRKNNVALESICCRGGAMKGMIRARRSPAKSFNRHSNKNDKTVFLRATFDGWATSHDWATEVFPIMAYDCPQYNGSDYYEDDDDGYNDADSPNDYDLYEFFVPIPPHLQPDALIYFAICFRCELGEFWDNNDGQNYSLRYHPSPSLTAKQQQPQQQLKQPASVPKSSNNRNNNNNNGFSASFFNCGPTSAAELDFYRARRIREIVCPDFSSDDFDNNGNINTNNNNKATPPAEIDIPYW